MTDMTFGIRGNIIVFILSIFKIVQSGPKVHFSQLHSVSEGCNNCVGGGGAMDSLINNEHRGKTIHNLNANL